MFFHWCIDCVCYQVIPMATHCSAYMASFSLSMVRCRIGHFFHCVENEPTGKRHCRPAPPAIGSPAPLTQEAIDRWLVDPDFLTKDHGQGGRAVGGGLGVGPLPVTSVQHRAEEDRLENGKGDCARTAHVVRIRQWWQLLPAAAGHRQTLLNRQFLRTMGFVLSSQWGPPLPNTNPKYFC